MIALYGLDLALYLHRVRTPAHGLSADPQTLDAVLARLSGVGGTQVTASFDDGYADAVAYVDDAAPRFPAIQFLVNVCPQKLEQRAGYRWDVGDDLEQHGDIDHENERADLRNVGDALATLDAVKALTRHRNVRLGNHSNCHLPLASLAAPVARRELEGSTRDFERLFGLPPRDFAFPFGWPGRHFTLEHVAVLRALGTERIWCTRESPMSRQWQRDGAVLPRVHLLGEWSAERALAWITRRALIYRAKVALKRSAGDFPL